MSGPQPASITRASAAAWRDFMCLLFLEAQRSVLCVIPITAEHLSYRKMKPKLQKMKPNRGASVQLGSLAATHSPPGLFQSASGQRLGPLPRWSVLFHAKVALRHESCAL